MKKSQIVTIMGLTIAMNVVLSRYLAISPAPFVRISIAFIAVAVGSILCGPLLGGIGAAVGDILGFVLFPTGGYIPGITFSAFLMGIVYGWLLYKKQPSLARVLITSAITALLIESAITSYWLFLAISGPSFYTIFIPRLIVNLIKVPIQTVIIYIIWSELGRLKIGFLNNYLKTE